ncbi:MAG TPA: transaldolase, partial [Candidatus Microsaccharimonas sp.]
MNNLEKLHSQFDQSPWLDNLSRDLLHTGKLADYVASGIRGVTSNPTILEKAILGSDAYDEQIKTLAASGADAETIYWRIIEDDIKEAAAILRPIWDESNGGDGFVSLEVSPRLAEDPTSTLEQAKRLWQEVGQPNLMIKVPATDASMPIIRELLLAGINVNVTLIFSLDHYKLVADAHLASHQIGEGNLARSVASFFVSRVDSEIDKRLEAIGTQEALDLRGQAAVAQAHIAYSIFLDKFNQHLVADPAGAGIQRLLWASTSTKNPIYDDLMYVTYLVAPHTVNTLPEDTIAKIVDHLPESTQAISPDYIEHAKETMNKLEQVGIDFGSVAVALESEGIQKFQASFDSLLNAITSKMAQ